MKIKNTAVVCFCSSAPFQRQRAFQSEVQEALCYCLTVVHNTRIADDQDAPLNFPTCGGRQTQSGVCSFMSTSFALSSNCRHSERKGDGKSSRDWRPSKQTDLVYAFLTFYDFAPTKNNLQECNPTMDNKSDFAFYSLRQATAWQISSLLETRSCWPRILPGVLAALPRRAARTPSLATPSSPPLIGTN